MDKRILTGALALTINLFGALACDSEALSVAPARESRRGESCAATNDCEDGLACVTQRCIQEDFPVSSTAKECFIVECEANTDCCVGFMAPALCESYATQCAGGDVNSCDLHAATCVCSQQCIKDRCQAPMTACTLDTECLAPTPVCELGECVQCRTDAECPAVGNRCIDNACRPPCTQDEECALFSSCLNGVCEETGCTSKRQCILFTGDSRASCKDGQCEVPCSTNAQCGELQLCEGGKCVFLGCEGNEDCRALLAKQMTPLAPGQRALCRESED